MPRPPQELRTIIIGDKEMVRGLAATLEMGGLEREHIFWVEDQKRLSVAFGLPWLDIALIDDRGAENVVRRVRTRFPRAKIYILTGDGDAKPVVTETVIDGVISKPFQPNDLLRQLGLPLPASPRKPEPEPP